MKGWNPFGRTRERTCPDGTIHTIYKNVDHAFPLYIDGWEGNLSSKVKAETDFDVSVTASYKSKIDGLLIALDEYNSSIMVDFRTTYLVYSSNPCENSEYFKRMTEKIMDKRDLIREKRLLLDALIQLSKYQPEDKEQFVIIFGKIVDRLLPQEAADVTISQLKQAEALAQEMAGEPK